MLSVLIETRNHEEQLTRTLASLVSGAVEGVVREVIVCDVGSTDHTHIVADHAGCRYIPSGGIAAGIRQAKADWLIVVEPGARLCDGWMGAVAAHASQSTGAARFSRKHAGKSKFFPRLFSARHPLADGLLITKRQAAALAQKGCDAVHLARSVSSRRISAEIVAAPRGSAV